MKKLAGLLLTATLVFGMTTVAFAAGSKSTTVSDGQTDEGATISHVIEDTKAEAAGIVTNEEGKMDVDDAAKEEMATSIEVAIANGDLDLKGDVSADNIQILDVFDVQAPADHEDGVAVDITIPGIQYEEGIVVLHFEDGAWVALPTKKGEGNTVVATFTTFSPTAIALVATTEDAAPADDEENPVPEDTEETTEDTTEETTASGKSPKTAESNAVVYVTLLALAAGAAAFATKRKFA